MKQIKKILKNLLLLFRHFLQMIGYHKVSTESISGRVFTMPDKLPDRRSKLLVHIYPQVQDGLEIGPLTSPTVTKEESGNRIKYIDHANKEMLQEKYKNLNVAIDDIVDIDYVWGKQTLQEIVGSDRFDYVIASHLIEHVPDMIGWLKEVADVLHDRGILSLAIPDKRYTFDCKREVSTPGQFIEDYLEHRRRPSPRAIFDHLAAYVTVDLKDIWDDRIEPGQLTYDNSALSAYQLVLESLNNEEYYDVHANVFTAEHFLNLLEIFSRLDLFEFIVNEYFDVTAYTNEFVVSLERLPRQRNHSESLIKQIESIKRARAKLNNLP